MKYICPLVTVSDIKCSCDFYEKILGQTVKSDYGENITFEGDFALHLDTHFSQLIDGKPIQKGSNSFELYFEDDDLEKFMNKLTLNQVQLVHPLREQPWKQRVIRFYDPDMNIIEVGETLECTANRLSAAGYSKAEIAKLMGVPVEMINQWMK
ncbi:MAG: VOC family protein [Tenuifilaceae bacterium]|jgi:catechol 2,3-dioxygenase-like lactoylglutathione lyase family enzyme|nr:VOC family protein [Tenuifilaceae bacterium]